MPYSEGVAGNEVHDKTPNQMNTPTDTQIDKAIELLIQTARGHQNGHVFIQRTQAGRLSVDRDLAEAYEVLVCVPAGRAVYDAEAILARVCTSLSC